MKKPRIFYGWYIAAGSIIMQALTNGFSVYAFGVFAVPLLAEFGWARGELYLAQTIAIAVGGIISPFIGKWVDRYGVKGLMSFGSLMCGTLLGLLSFTSSIWYFYGIYILMAMARPTISHVPINTMVTHWFDKKRGFVIGLVTSGIGLGGIILPPLAALLIHNYGWRSSYVILGIISVASMFPLSFFVMRLKPEEKGLLPDGRSSEEDNYRETEPVNQAQGPQAVWTLSAALKVRIFWLIVIIFFFFRFGLHGVLHHMVPYYTGVGVPTTVAATMLSCIAAMGIVGKLVGGHVGDRTGPRAVVIYSHLLLAGSVVLLLLYDSIVGYWIFAATFGFFMGVLVPALPLMISYCFGRQSFGALFGTIFIAHSAGVGLGPVFSGYLFDFAGSYQQAYAIHIVLLLSAGAIAYWVRAPKLEENISVATNTPMSKASRAGIGNR